MILIAGLFHKTLGLCFSKTIELREVAAWFAQASRDLSNIQIIYLDNRIIDSCEFSPLIIYPNDAAHMIRRINTP